MFYCSIYIFFSPKAKLLQLIPDRETGVEKITRYHIEICGVFFLPLTRLGREGWGVDWGLTWMAEPSPWYNVGWRSPGAEKEATHTVDERSQCAAASGAHKEILQRRAAAKRLVRAARNAGGCGWINTGSDFGETGETSPNSAPMEAQKTRNCRLNSVKRQQLETELP